MKKQTIKIPKIKVRTICGFNPVTRVKPSKKNYSRKKLKILI
jgi:hypothetical protein